MGYLEGRAGSLTLPGPQPSNSCMSTAQSIDPGDELPLIAAPGLDFTASPLFVNRSARFVLKIPRLVNGGEPLVIPHGERMAGRAIKSDRGQAARGIVFYNGVDRAWQAARGDGKEVIIINDLSAEASAQLDAEMQRLKGAKPELDLIALKALLRFAKDQLGVHDHYHKRLDLVLRDMAPTGSAEPGHWRVTKATRHRALWVPRPFRFDGPVPQRYPDGAVLVTDSTRVWGVATEVFIRNFKRLANGQEQTLSSASELPQFRG
jgi:hypothetical protein